MPKKDKNNSLGKSLKRKIEKVNNDTRHTTDFEEVGSKLKPKLDQDALGEFIENAALSNAQFEALRGTKIKNEHTVIDVNTYLHGAPKMTVDLNKLKLRIPRRPKWDSKTTGEELRQRENESFVAWRKDIAKMEEDILGKRLITPFEKNIEVWRQLWRVVERSDVLVQIVDGRNPMFFRCEDLENYVREVDPEKLYVLLINKCDLISKEIRAEWHKYLNEKGIRHMFFSALSEQEKINLLPDEETNTQKKLTPQEIDEEFSRLLRGEETAPKQQAKKSQKEQYKTKRERKLEESEAIDKKLKSKNQKGGANDLNYVDFSKLAGESSGYETVSEEEEAQPDKKFEDFKQEEEPSKTQAEKSGGAGSEAIAKAELPSKSEEKDSKALDTGKQNPTESISETQEKSEIVVKETEQKDQPVEQKQDKVKVEEEEDDELYYNRSNLLLKLKQIVTEAKKHKPEHKNTYVIGMVGFPNVGKSSVINVLCKRKLVGVGSQPGKTKHFQTLYIEKDLILCDCPGLVFPSFTASRAEMICHGVLSIDTMKDYLNPIQYILERVPLVILEKYYKVKCPVKNPSASIFLQTYAQHRGFVTGRSLPDEAKASRIILKDFVNGKIIYNHLPPDCSKQFWQSNPLNELEEQKEEEASQEKSVAQEQSLSEEATKLEHKLHENKNLDKDFFDDDLLEDEDGNQNKKIKLTKDQKRQLKFALQRGEEVDEQKLFGGRDQMVKVKSKKIK